MRESRQLYVLNAGAWGRSGLGEHQISFGMFCRARVVGYVCSNFQEELLEGGDDVNMDCLYEG